MTPVQGAGLVDYRNRVESFQPKQQETAGIWFHFPCFTTRVSTLAPPAPLLYNPSHACPVPLPAIKPVRTCFTHDVAGTMLVCLLLGGLIMGAGSPVLAQVPSRGATPSEPVGASMAVLAMLQDADVLPPESTPEANRVIKVVIQFQSVFMKSGDPAVQVFLNQALATTGGSGADEAVSRFRSRGWTSDVLEALSEQWVATAIDQRERLALGFRQFNVSLADFNWLMELVAKARTVFRQRGQNIHQVFAQRRREMPGGAQ